MESKIRPIALAAVFALFLWIDFRLTLFLVGVQPLGIDFLAIWGGARIALEHPDRLYDFAAVTHSQQWLLGEGSKVRPFVYPPSTALLFAPFALAGFWAAYAGFVLLTGALYFAAARRISRGIAPLALLALAPPVVLSALAGQLSFLIGGLVLLAFVFRDRPVATGVLLGIAAAIKPQLLVLFPLALALEGRWRALAAAFATGGLVCLASLATFGLGAWMDWFAALPRFARLVADDERLLVNVITPIGALVRADVEGPALMAAQAVCVLAGAALVWWTFARPSTPGQRLVALIGGGLLITPYAMSYELAVIAPAVAALAVPTSDSRWLYYLLALLLLSLMLPGLVALLGLLVCVLAPGSLGGSERPQLGEREA
ncbi:glycosyltransferase family 87 protein [Phenylobacterium sp.]|uniref:glycosyltransferase family 87 protein n=1 Tax=Phenylobacterium sp. TaxID=1871053 RepID=UPI002737B0D6|nr:glycosyltransferase family 87 protein [Phenylobacterium sp.]MDP3869319.1 glycosyltransferase family 87 protein [Phenylobacterium sp.]